MAAEEKKGGAIARKFSSVVKFFRDCVAEIKKIVWPTPKTAFKNMGIVLVAMIVIGAVVFGLDSLFGWLLGLVM